MDFITYQFDSPSQFYAELKDLLEEGGFHDNPESQVNTFISLIVQYQDEFLDPSGQDLEQCCYRLIDSDLFQNNTLSITTAIIDRAVQSQNEDDMWITYHVLLYAGMEFPKVYHWMLTSEYLAKLKYQVLQVGGTRLQLMAVSLMYEICRVQSLKPQDLALVDEDFLHYLFDLVEGTRTDEDEELNYRTIKLLLTFNEQFMLNQSACRAARNYTPSNPLLSVLADRSGASSTFGENLIFMLNRADETALQTLILKLLYLFFTSPNSQLNQFFYTNDLHVLIDVIIRELWDLPEEEEPLRHAYLRVMGPLLTNTQLRQEPTTYKRTEILKVLSELGGSEVDLGEALRNHLWEQEMLEQQPQQSRKLTFRDRFSSNLPTFSSSPSSSAFFSTPPSSAGKNNISSTQSQRSALSSTSSNNSSSSVVLENVLPPSRSNSSTNLHVHMERRNSQSRAVSATTQRLVERVLREWLENEMKTLSQSQNQTQDQRIAIPVAQ
ncbi:hypothetical protein BGX21_004200 [Mortierella sp. AD011]|nr:hypothetical protein BGX20_008671 [Mortierella sp. AD010]KAF9403439.1 hypothetical protein BGX21_004200 [Mortierella sp. AD011]